MTKVRLSKSQRLLESLARLKESYPEVKCALEFKNPFELAVATILSAQCTDERVNRTTPALFEQFPTPEALSRARCEDVEKIVYSTGFYRNKAKNLIALARRIQNEFGGKLPQDIETLAGLPGIGRKTANVVLGNAFGIASGIAVDTHVTRLMNLLKIVNTENAQIIERELMSIVPESEWISFTHYLITHGRQVCIARRPACSRCVIAELCPSRHLESKRKRI